MTEIENRIMSKDYLKIILHAFFGWLCTVRGGPLRYGNSTEICVGNGTVHREFWHSNPSEETPVEELAEAGILFCTDNNTGLARKTGQNNHYVKV